MKAWQLVGILCLGSAGCRSPLPELPPDPFEAAAPEREASAPRAARSQRVGSEIVVAGKRYEIQAPVVLWYQAPRYNAYSKRPRFSREGEHGLRYQPGRTPRSAALEQSVRRRGWDLANLQEQVDQFVLHYDVAGTSQTCFKVLQDLRGLSVHFLLDLDGTLYQTLDLKEQAWHASQANPRSIGVEIAHIGAYPEGQPSPLDDWYTVDAFGRRLRLPERLGDGGLRLRDFVARPARPELIRGRIQGGRLQQFDYTPEQYETLVRLSAALARIFPKLRLDAPRDASGKLRQGVLSESELEAFQGILGHYHVSKSKIDPGPALNWEALLGSARKLLGQP